MCTRSPRPLIRLALVAALAVVIPGAARAAPRDELLRLVPDDVAFCLVVQDLRTQARALAASPFAEAFRKSPFAAALKDSDEFKKLALLDAELRKQLGFDAAAITDKLLGDAFVLAYRSSPPGKTDQDQGLFLLRARDADTLGDFVERLNRVQKESGDLKEIEERRHAGVPYFRRVERKGENFYYVNGPVLAFSSQEAILRQAVERDREKSTAEPAVAKHLRLLGADKALAGLWINPRAFDAEMARNLEQAKGADAVIQRALQRYWKVIDGAALALSLEKDARLTLTLRARTEDLPPAAKRLLAAAKGPSEVWDRFPQDALLTVAGRLDPVAILEALGDFQTKEARAALSDALERSLGAPSGKDFAAELLPALGPDFGLCLLAPAGGDKSPVPQGLLALRVGSDKGADEAILSAIDFYVRLAMVTYRNQGKAISLKLLRQDRIEVKYLSGEGAFPAGVQPAYALKDGYLLFASSPEVIRRFGPATVGKTVGEVPLLRLSARGLHEFLTTRRDALLPVVAERNDMSKEEAGRRLDALAAVLRLLDRVEISQSSEAGRLSLTLRLQTAQPLK
jgi:Protein of unknown function (DUF3352)